MKRPAIPIALAFLLGLLLAASLGPSLGREEAIEDGVDLTLTGRVYRREARQNSHVLYLTDIQIPFDKSKNSVVQSLSEKKFLIYYEESKKIPIGRRVEVKGEFHWFSRARNPGNFDARSYYNALGIAAFVYADEVADRDGDVDWLKEWLSRVRESGSSMLHALLCDRDASVLGAMLLGEKGLINKDVKELYQENGIAHILAISGLHISLLGYGLYKLLRRFRLPLFGAAGGAVLIMLAYGSMTGVSVSAVRALTMFLLALMAEAAGRTYDMASALAIAVPVVLSAWPKEAGQAGFLLSFGAVAGILLFVPAFAPEEKAGRLKSALASGVALQWMLFPLLAYFYFMYPLYSALLNLVLLPFLPVLFVSALLGIFGGLLHPVFGRALLLPARGILLLYDKACEVCSGLPLAGLVTGKPHIGKLLFFYGAALLILFAVKKLQERRLLLLLPLTLLLFLLPVNSGLTITVLDVGQGDGIYIETKRHTRILIDGGSTDIKGVGTYRMEPFLKSQGAGVLDYVIVTHGDADHINGIQELLESDCAVRIKKLLLPEAGGGQEELLKLAAAAKKRGSIVERIRQGKILKEGKLTLTCLHPFKGETSDDKNELSTVMDLRCGDFSMLFTGDLGQEGEEELLKAGLLLRTTVLKVGHHGSKGSSSREFLRCVSPQTALISCGIKNRYGHPHRELLERLKEAGCGYYLTSECGAMTIKTDGSGYRLYRFVSRKK